MTSGYVSSHPGSVASGADALDDGFRSGLYLLTGLLLLGALIAGSFIRPSRPSANAEPVVESPGEVVREAA